MEEKKSWEEDINQLEHFYVRSVKSATEVWPFNIRFTLYQGFFLLKSLFHHIIFFYIFPNHAPTGGGTKYNYMPNLTNYTGHKLMRKSKSHRQPRST